MAYITFQDTFRCSAGLTLFIFTGNLPENICLSKITGKTTEIKKTSLKVTPSLKTYILSKFSKDRMYRFRTIYRFEGSKKQTFIIKVQIKKLEY